MRNPDGPVLVAWASKNGQTENLAQRISEILQEQGLEVDLRPVKGIDWSHLDRWSALVLGSPTYGSGDLHGDWDKPERALRDLSLVGYPGAAFGCGQPRYPTAWWAVDILENRLKNGGATVVLSAYKADTLAGLRVRDVDVWARDLAEHLKAY